MKRTKHLVGLLSILVLFAFQTRAQEVPVQPVQEQPAVYRLELVFIFEDGATEFIFVIGNAGFKSVAALKKFIGQLPRGTKLEWSPGCRRMGNEPLLSSAEEMSDFRRFCEEQGIDFVLIPSG